RPFTGSLEDRRRNSSIDDESRQHITKRQTLFGVFGLRNKSQASQRFKVDSFCLFGVIDSPDQELPEGHSDYMDPFVGNIRETHSKYQEDPDRVAVYNT
uniref:Rap-GAP domain-containing protein n=1 Tax=Ascaris lumbricoides TaxID=6252 RepID=A0A0M3HHS3_ASCLU